jgi:predicted small metal-binding protein
MILQPRANAPGTQSTPRIKEETMARVINCECGQVIRGENDEELVSKATDHVNQNHPELVGKLSEHDLLGMAEEE